MVARIKNAARSLGIAEVLIQGGQLILQLSDKPNIDPLKIVKLKTNRQYLVNLKIKKPERISIEFRKEIQDYGATAIGVLTALSD